MNASPTAWKSAPLLAGAVIVLAALAAYHNCFTAAFILDDAPSILENRTIRQLWPIWPVLSPSNETRPRVEGRPLVNLSLAINYALGGFDVRGYHAVNLAIHILAGLTLFGVVRRTLQQPVLRERFGAASLPLAMITALIWIVHPLQTESVTYTVQRAESLMGLFYLLTLYCFIRGSVPNGWQPYGHASPTNHLTGIVGRERLKAFAPKIWYLLAVVACLLGMASKEVMVSAPLIVLLYDRTFVAGSFREAWRRRWPLYLVLASTWMLLGYVVAATATSGGYLTDVPWWMYLLTQLYAMVHYLRLSFWPDPLVFDYGRPLARSVVEVAPYALIIVALLAGTVVNVWRWPAVGFLGVCFFAILAPTSSVVPVAGQTVAEHRMYLPLATVVVMLVVGAFLLGKTLLSGREKFGRIIGWGLSGAVASMLTVLTIQRNVTYGSPLTMWQDTVSKRPNNSRARSDLGLALFEAGRVEEAIGQYEEALRVDPNFAKAHINLGMALLQLGKIQEALQRFEQAVRLDPQSAQACTDLGIALFQLGKIQDGIGRLEQAVRVNPHLAEAHNNLGFALVQVGRVEDAIRHCEEAVRIKPANDKAHFGLALALVQAGRVKEAVKHYEQVVRINPGHADAHNNLAWILATDDNERLRDPARAMRLAERACELTKSRDPWFMDTLAAASAEAGRFDDAIRTAQQAISLAKAAGLEDLAKDIEGRLELYKASQPFRSKSTTAPNS